MPTLKWIGKDRVINYHNEVPFRLLKENKNLSVNSNDTESLLIKGDNLEALKALLPYYYNRIKVIYIDPPYNTGNEDWVYNDNVNSPEIKKWLGKVVGGETDDLSRHDKWLCMMMPRLRLLEQLLRDDGVIFVSIDDNELVNLKMLMDEIFLPQNFIQNFMWLHGKGKKDRWSRTLQQYVLCYAKNKNKLKPWSTLSYANYEFSNPDNDPRGSWFSGSISFSESRSNRNHPNYFKLKSPSGIVWERQWQRSEEEMQDLLEENKVFFGLPPEYKNVPRIKIFPDDIDEQIPPNIIDDVESTRSAQRALDELMGSRVFEYPKPVGLIKYLIRISSGKAAVILDSFAGSGTTGHAVLDLNQEDGGNRQFILVECEPGIAKGITAERLKRVIQSYSNGGSNNVIKMQGLGGGFKFFELGKPLFDKHKQIIGHPCYEDLAGHIYFTETHSTIDWEKGNRDDWYVGENSGVHYFIIYGGRSELGEEFLEITKRYPGKKVAYADVVMIDDDELERSDIVFKQIPYEIKTF